MADDNVLKVQIQLDDGTVAQGFAKIEEKGKSTFERIAAQAAGVFTGELALQALNAFTSQIKETFSQAINSASDYGAEVQKLNGNLALAGQYSEATSKRFTDLADTIQATTAYSDDQVLSIAALASNFTHSAKQTEKLTKATLDFAAATGKDANDAAQQLALTLQGNIGRLGRYFPELKKFSEAQLEAGAAVDFIAKRFSGSAEGQANTYAAAIQQVRHAYDDVLKSLGQFITDSPTAVGLIKLLAQDLLGIANYFSDLRGQTDVFGNFLQSILSLGGVINSYLIRPFEILFNLVAAGVRSVVLGMTVIGTAIAGIGEAFVGVIPVANFFAESLVNLILGRIKAADFATALKQKFADTFAITSLGLQSIANQAGTAQKALTGISTATPLSDGLELSLVRYSGALDNAKAKTVEFVNQVKAAKPEIEQNLPDREAIFGVQDAFAQLGKGMSDSIDNVIITSVKAMKQAGDAAIKGFANAFTSGFNAVGKALVKGQDVFAAFGAALLASLGQAATQLGGTFILMGLGKTLIGDPSGPALVAVGGALAVLGGVLSSFGEGVTGTSNPSTSVNTGGGSAIDTSASTSSDTATSIAQTQAPGVTVNIQGDVLDSRETGLRLVDLIQNSFSTSGAKVVYS